MTHVLRTLRNLAPAAAMALVSAVVACGPGATVDSRSDLDRAVAAYVAGDYRTAVTRLQKVAAESGDEATRREAYTYLGRTHMALGDTDAAIEAFTRCAHEGDRGPCLDYLETLRQYQAGSPEGLHIIETITRADLAAAAVRVFDGKATLDPGGPEPLAVAAERGWMPAMADGNRRADEPVTQAAFYVFVSRVLAQAGLADKTGTLLPGGYRAAMRETDPVSGAEAIAVLERIQALKEANGR
jgi:tetratricopeptide (TPR) repeat protein